MHVTAIEQWADNLDANADNLAALRHGAALRLAAEVRDMAERLRGWVKAEPGPEERGDGLRQLLDLNERVRCMMGGSR